ncbi:hypothetical protein TU84_10920 [Pseudomonas helleri]|nr:hypothetical protein TU84_10920 [Pseudomonas helleri]
MLLLKFYVIFLFFYGFTALLNSRLISNEQLTRITTFLIYVYSLAIVFGAVFGVALMRYYDTDRWGVKGIIISGNEASGVLLVSLAWSMLQFSRSQSRTLLPLVIAALLLSGTKSSIIGMLILFVGYYIAKGGISSIIKMCFSALLLILASGYFYLYFDAVQEAVAKSADYFEYQYYNFANKSLITLALSGRDLKLYTVYNEIINDYPVALFIGGFPVGSYSTEMDFFDLLALSGIFGVLIYTYYWLRIWKKQFIYNKFESRFRLAFVITFIALGFLGGHMFYSAVTAPLLASLAISFRENQIRNKRKTQRPLYIRRENLSPSI